MNFSSLINQITSIKGITISSVEISSKILNFLSIVLLTRILSSDDYGLFAYLSSLVLLSSVFMDSGINYLAFNKSLKDNLSNISTLIVSKAALSLIVILVFAAFMFFVDEAIVGYVLLYSLFIAFTSMIAFLKMVARGRELLKADIFAIILSPLIRVIALSIILILNGTVNLQVILFIYALVEIAVFVVTLYHSEFVVEVPRSVFKIMQSIRITMKESYSYLLYYFALIGIRRIEIIAMESSLDSREVAYYSTALNIYLVYVLFFSAFVQARFRSILDHLKENQYRQIIIILFAIIISVVIGWLFTPLFYSFAFPREYSVAISVAQILMVAVPFSVFVDAILSYFNYYHLTKLNYLLLNIFFLVKILVLIIAPLSSIMDYALVYLFMEIVTVVGFFIGLVIKKRLK